MTFPLPYVPPRRSPRAPVPFNVEDLYPGTGGFWARFFDPSTLISQAGSVPLVYSGTGPILAENNIVTAENVLDTNDFQASGASTRPYLVEDQTGWLGARFTNYGQTFTHAGPNVAPTDAFTMFLVGRLFSGVNADSRVFRLATGSNNPQAEFIAQPGNPNFRIAAIGVDRTVSVTAPDGAIMAMVIRFDASEGLCRINISGNVSTISTAGMEAFSWQNASFQLNVQAGADAVWFEAGGWGGAISEGQEAQLMNYLQRFNISL